MELFLDRQRTQRPTGPMVVDWSNPITRGLVSVHIAGHSGGWAVNGASLIASPAGLSERYASASSNYLSSPLAVTYPLTMFALHRQTSIGVTRALVGVGNSSTGRHLLYLGTSNELLLFSGSSPGQWSSTPSGVFYSDTSSYHIAVGVVRSSTNRQAYYDGVSPVAANTNTDTVAASNTVAIGAYWNSGGPAAGFYWPGEIALAGVFNRALSDQEIKSLSDNPWQLFAPRRIWVPQTAAGAGTQTLTPARLDNAQTFYAPAVSVGAVTVTPGRVDNVNQFFAPTVSQGAQIIAPGLVTNSQTFYAPTVTPGAVTVSPGLLTNAQTFYAPTVRDPAAAPTGLSGVYFDVLSGRLLVLRSGT